MTVIGRLKGSIVLDSLSDSRRRMALKMVPMPVLSLAVLAVLVVVVSLLLRTNRSGKKSSKRAPKAAPKALQGSKTVVLDGESVRRSVRCAGLRLWSFACCSIALHIAGFNSPFLG
jgi:hypothetical protein